MITEQIMKTFQNCTFCAKCVILEHSAYTNLPFYHYPFIKKTFFIKLTCPNARLWRNQSQRKLSHRMIKPNNCFQNPVFVSEAATYVQLYESTTSDTIKGLNVAAKMITKCNIKYSQFSKHFCYHESNTFLVTGCPIF